MERVTTQTPCTGLICITIVFAFTRFSVEGQLVTTSATLFSILTMLVSDEKLKCYSYMYIRVPSLAPGGNVLKHQSCLFLYFVEDHQVTISSIFKHQIHFACSYFIKTCRNIVIQFSYILRADYIQLIMLKKFLRICLAAVFIMISDCKHLSGQPFIVALIAFSIISFINENVH